MSAKSTVPSSGADVIREAREKPRSVYLLVGEPFRTESVARDLVEALVPAQHQSFNLEKYDGRTTPMATVVDSLRMRGFFGGQKVIWVREPTIFLSGEKRTDLTAAMFLAWMEDRHSDAAEKLLTLAAMAGWTQVEFEAFGGASSSQKAAADLLGRTIDSAERSVLGAIHLLCAQRGMTVSEFRDDGGILQDFLASGLSPDSTLIFTCTAIDRRKKIVKVIQETGILVELEIERERTGAISGASAEKMLDQLLTLRGKKIDPGAQQLVLRRAGADTGAFVSEIEKLCLYVGESTTIRPGDVMECFRDLSESWIFDFTKALSSRDAATALPLFRDLIDQGEHPLRLIAVIMREIRLLLLAHDCIASTLAGKWSSRVTFTTFRDRQVALLSEEQREAFGNVHPYVLFVCFQNAGRVGDAVLKRAMLRLQQLDVRFKSSSGDPRLLLEMFVLDLSLGRPFDFA